MAFYAVVERLRLNQGRNQNLTYVNVVVDVRERAGTFAELAALAPWNDPTDNSFAIELTEAEHLALRDDRFHDGVSSLPKWQQETAPTGSTKSFGSFADPESAASAFTADVELTDPRWIVRIGDGDPEGPNNHIATLDLDENQNSPGQQDRYVLKLRLYNADDTQSGTNAQDQKTEIAGKLMIFDFNSGLTDFGIDTTVVGSVQFPSNHEYRVVGPGGEKFFQANIYGRNLRAET